MTVSLFGGWHPIIAATTMANARTLLWIALWRTAIVTGFSPHHQVASNTALLGSFAKNGPQLRTHQGVTALRQTSRSEFDASGRSTSELVDRKGILSPTALKVSTSESVAFGEVLEDDSTAPLIPPPTIELPLIQLALAGSLTTFASDLAMHPVDCIKTVQQSSMGLDMSVLQAAGYLWKTDGLAGFYHGFLTYGCSDAVGGAFKFAVWETLRTRLPNAWYGVVASAALAFVASSVILVPGELLKNQLQMAHYSGLTEAVQGTFSRSGFSGFYAGYDAVLYRDIPYTIIELGLYQWFQSFMSRQSEIKKLVPENLIDIASAALTGGIVALATTPLDTIKTKLMVEDQFLDSNFLDCMLTTVDEHGVAAVFAGWLARLAWVMPFTAIYLPTYDFLKRQLEGRYMERFESD